MKMKDCPSGNFNDEFLNDDNKLGFIMFETGLEGVSIKVRGMLLKISKNIYI